MSIVNASNAELPRPKYLLSIDALRTLADAVCELDALKGYMISTEQARIEALIKDSFALIEAAAGPDAGQIFDQSEELPRPPEGRTVNSATIQILSRLHATECEVGWVDGLDCYRQEEESEERWCWPCRFRWALMK